MFPASHPLTPTLSSSREEYKLWGYNPSISAAVAATVIFGVLTMIHAIRLTRKRTSFCIPFIIGGIFEAAGYAARIAAHNNTNGLGPYIAQSLLILLAPIFFAASIYSLLGRLVRRLDGSNIALVHPSIMTKFFVWLDVLCFVIQGGGGGLLAQATSSDTVKFGNGVVLTGLTVQMYVYCFYIRVAVSFQRGFREHPVLVKRCQGFAWRRYFAFLNGACACLGARNLFRLVEYAMGKDGFLMVNEWPLYVGDFALMAVMFALCLAWYDPDISGTKHNGK